MISSVLDSQICQLQANLFTSKTCGIGGLQEKVPSPKYNDSVQRQGNCPSSLEFGLETPQQKRKIKKKEPYMQRLQTIICVLCLHIQACVHLQ